MASNELRAMDTPKGFLKVTVKKMKALGLLSIFLDWKLLITLLVFKFVNERIVSMYLLTLV